MKRFLLRLASAVFFALLLAALPREAFAERRVALVIGNSGYQSVAQLPNTRNDASAITELFQKAGFDIVDARQDLGVVEFKRAVREFMILARGADTAVMYFSGHGIEVAGTNYLIPVDAKLATDYDAEDEAVSLDRVILALEPAKRLRLVILDACRDNPFLRKMQRTVAVRAVANGLAKVEPASTDTLIAYAAKAGSVSYDGFGPNSPFTTALIKYIGEPGLDIRIALGRVRDEVLKITNRQQEPFVYGSLGGTTVALVPAPEVKKPEPRPAATQDEIRRAYELASQVGTKEAWESFIKTYPSGFYAELARLQLAKLNTAAEETRARSEQEAKARAEQEAKAQSEQEAQAKVERERAERLAQQRQEEARRANAAEAERVKRAEQEGRARAEQEAKARAEQEANARGEKERAERLAREREEERRAKAEAERQKARAEQERAERLALLRQEEERRAKAAEAERLKAEQEAKARANQESKARAEQEAKARADRDAKARGEKERAERLAREREEERRAKAEAERQEARAEQERAERLALLRQDEERHAKADEAERLKAQREAERLKTQREAALPQRGKIEPNEEHSCADEEKRLARLRADPVREDVARFARELHCAALRPQVNRLLESVGGAPTALAPMPTPPAPASALDRPTPTPNEPRENKNSEPDSRSHACRRDEERLTQLRANPSRDAVARFARELACEDLRPQVQRLLESVGG